MEPITPEISRNWGSYESLCQTFQEIGENSGVVDNEWARVESDMKAADLADAEQTLSKVTASFPD